MNTRSNGWTPNARIGVGNESTSITMVCATATASVWECSFDNDRAWVGEHRATANPNTPRAFGLASMLQVRASFSRRALRAIALMLSKRPAR